MRSAATSTLSWLRIGETRLLRASSRPEFSCPQPRKSSIFFPPARITAWSSALALFASPSVWAYIWLPICSWEVSGDHQPTHRPALPGRRRPDNGGGRADRQAYLGGSAAGAGRASRIRIANRGGPFAGRRHSGSPGRLDVVPLEADQRRADVPVRT